jgi:hypothetical protein
MTGNDSHPDDAADGSDDVGGFRFPMSDGGSDDRQGRTDGSGETATGFPDVGTDAAERADGGHDLGRSEFGGFDFGTWLEETEARTPTTTVEETVEETADAVRDVTPAFAGFGFRQWMESDDTEGPSPPPDQPRVVTRSIAEVDPQAAATSESAAFSGSVDASATTGFAFAEWLGEAETEFVDPEALQPEPEPEPETPSVGATVPGEPGYPTPPGGGISELPPVKVAVFAVFAATLAAVALTIAGPAAPLGPATGFADPAPAGNQGGAPAATATPSPTATATPAPTPTDTDAPTATATQTQTETPTPTPTPTPTATPTATVTPTPEPTASPTPTDNGSDDGGILDPIFD